MTRLFSKILSLAAASAVMFAAPVLAHTGSTTHHTSTMSSHKHSCPAGDHWVKGYHTKSGKYVKGYCRK
jgi:hypothetical protein